MIIGEIVERLISIKDNCELVDENDIEAINNACNILSKRFERLSESGYLINEHITSVDWYKEDFKKQLQEEGFEQSDENVKMVLKELHLIEKEIQERCGATGYDVIDNVIYNCRGKLKPIEYPYERED